jgi:hypothetical protein
MMRILRLRDALLWKIHQARFKDLAKTDVVHAAVIDIKDEQSFKAMYYVLCVVFPAISALCFCDKREQCLDKIYYLSKHTMNALFLSMELLNDTDCLSLSLMSSWRNVRLMYTGRTNKRMRMNKRKSESCMYLVI